MNITIIAKNVLFVNSFLKNIFKHGFFLLFIEKEHENPQNLYADVRKNKGGHPRKAPEETNSGGI